MARGAAALTDTQQSAANSALCSIVAKHVPNLSTASPSILSDSSVLSAAAPLFASSIHLPLPEATGMLQSYVMQHASDVLASCAVSNAESNMTAKVPDASSVTSRIPQASNLPAIPKIP
jgi:hypothetical protein